MCLKTCTLFFANYLPSSWEDFPFSLPNGSVLFICKLTTHKGTIFEFFYMLILRLYLIKSQSIPPKWFDHWSSDWNAKLIFSLRKDCLTTLPKSSLQCLILLSVYLEPYAEDKAQGLQKLPWRCFYVYAFGEDIKRRDTTTPSTPGKHRGRKGGRERWREREWISKKEAEHLCRRITTFNKNYQLPLIFIFQIMHSGIRFSVSYW